MPHQELVSPTLATSGGHSKNGEAQHLEGKEEEKSLATLEVNLIYELADEEPEIHIRTYIAVAAMIFFELRPDHCPAGAACCST